MAIELAGDRIQQILCKLRSLLASAGFDSEADRFQRLGERFEMAEDMASRQRLIRSVLVMYQGGMGSFQDLVLVDADGVSPAQDEFHRLRNELFEEARNELR